jgi:hypothetical protein
LFFGFFPRRPSRGHHPGKSPIGGPHPFAYGGNVGYNSTGRDADGFSNHTEFLAGTKANDPTSALRVVDFEQCGRV